MITGIAIGVAMSVLAASGLLAMAIYVAATERQGEPAYQDEECICDC